MLVKSEQDEIQLFLADSSNMKGGHASRVLLPESPGEVCEALARASRERTPVTVAGADGRFHIQLGGGRGIEARLPSYTMPATRKHAAGYYVAPGMDLIDLFIGSEGTLGVVTEAEVALLPRPEGVLSGVVFFRREDDLLAFVREARGRSLATRAAGGAGEAEGAGETTKQGS